jgi:glycosyltransferase involved in cell wall biosynthesis
MPLALLEAMSCGRAVVASAIAQHLEVGPDAGVSFVSPGDAAAMAEAIAGLLDDTDTRVRAGVAARRTAVARYSWDAVAERFERLYRDLVG